MIVAKFPFVNSELPFAIPSLHNKYSKEGSIAKEPNYRIVNIAS